MTVLEGILLVVLMFVGYGLFRVLQTNWKLVTRNDDDLLAGILIGFGSCSIFIGLYALYSMWQ